MESLFNVKKSSMEIIDPNAVRLIDYDNNSHVITNRALESILSVAEINKNVYQKLYDMDKDIWAELLRKRTSPELENVLKNSIVIMHKNYIFEIIENDEFNNADVESIEEIFSKFFDSLESDNILRKDIVNLSTKDDVINIRILGNDVVSNNNNIPTIFMTLNITRKWYEVYQGFSLPDGDIFKTTLFKKPIIQTDSIVEFARISLADDLLNATKPLLELGEYYTSNQKLSLRECLDTVKILNLKFDYDEDGFITDIQDCKDSTYARKLIVFFNSFSLPFKVLKKTDYFKRYFKFDNITIEDIIGFISSEISNPHINVSGNYLAYISSFIFKGSSDKSLVDNTIKEYCD